MGWTSNDYNHEGWVAAVAPDGRLTGTSNGARMIVHGTTGHYEPAGEFFPDQKIVPHDLIMSWRGACTCGWQGEL